MLGFHLVGREKLLTDVAEEAAEVALNSEDTDIVSWSRELEEAGEAGTADE